MRTFDIEEAKTDWLRLIDEAAAGDPFIITKAGKPMAKVEPLEPTPIDTSRRFGFMEGEIQVPEDFDTMGQAEIEAMFYGEGVHEDGEDITGR